MEKQPSNRNKYISLWPYYSECICCCPILEDNAQKGEMKTHHSFFFINVANKTCMRSISEYWKVYIIGGKKKEVLLNHEFAISTFNLSCLLACMWCSLRLGNVVRSDTMLIGRSSPVLSWRREKEIL